MNLSLSHFEAALLFALITSLVFGVVTKKTDNERIQYGLQTFGYFMLALFGIAWIMKLGHG
jgi:ABC-type dipeptide/oligopeptide/nickel transport system permease component